VRWLEVSLTVTGELAEPVADLLARHVPGGVALEAERGESGAAPAPGDVVVRAFLPLDDRVAAQRTQIEEGLWHLGQIAPLPRPAYHEIAEEDWAEAWKTHYHPIPVGRRLLVLPAWLPVPQGDRLPLILDPGMAFGTGTHPSTQLCLAALEEHLQPGATVLDLGCGSGILGIAAARLGAARVVALDTDPVAVEATRQNAARNGVSEVIEAAEGSLEAALDLLGPSPSELTMANILSSVLETMLRDGLARTVGPDGVVILSGILADQVESMTRVAEAMGLRLLATLSDADWRALVLRRP
jgi:ribosomal protein L11 methyltransferase